MLDFEDVYDEMEKLIYWIANRETRKDIFLMDADELIGELFLELWKVFRHYEEDVSDMEEMKKLLKQSLDNRVSELVYRYGVTHRKAKISAHSLDSPAPYAEDDNNLRDVLLGGVVVNIGATVRSDPAALSLSKERVEETEFRLSPAARKVFRAVIHGHPMLEAQIKLAGVRAKEVYKGRGTIKVKTWHVAQALAMDENEVKEAFKEIRAVYEEVIHEYA